MNQNMRPPPGRPEWSVEAIADADPANFAKKLEAHLNALTANGFQLVNMAERGPAVIVSAVRALGPMPGHHLPPPHQPRPSTPKKLKGATEERVVYTYKDMDDGEIKTKEFDTLWQAASFALSDARYMNNEEALTVLPISISKIRATSYEPKDFFELSKSGPATPSS